jgi:hypothetical protein
VLGAAFAGDTGQLMPRISECLMGWRSLHWLCHWLWLWFVINVTPELSTIKLMVLCNTVYFHTGKPIAWIYELLNIVIWFLDSVHRPVFKRIKAIKTQRFGDWICLRPQVDGAG